MDLNELKLVTASNIIKLRTSRGLTQAELGALLNYSDKTISKWERGEAIPDAFVLTQLAEIFGVNVDFILSSHDKWEKPKENEVEEVRYSVEHIIAIAVIGVLTAFLIAFVTLWLMGIVEWRIFLFALSAAILVYMILICVFKRRRQFRDRLFLSAKGQSLAVVSGPCPRGGAGLPRLQREETPPSAPEKRRKN